VVLSALERLSGKPFTSPQGLVALARAIQLLDANPDMKERDKTIASYWALLPQDAEVRVVQDEEAEFLAGCELAIALASRQSEAGRRLVGALRAAVGPGTFLSLAMAGRLAGAIRLLSYSHGEWGAS